MIVTLDDFEATEDVVTVMQQMYPGVSLELAREALIYDEGDAAEAETLNRRFRDEHYADDEGEAPA
jgi:hypothetical protein